MDETTRNLLMDMIIHARHGVSFVKDLSLDTFQADIKAQFATIRAIEIVGEAANKVPDVFKLQQPGIPWSQMVGMRHRLIHGYGQVNPEIIYQTARAYLPVLIENLDDILGDTTP